MGGKARHDRNEEHEEHDAADRRDPTDDLWRITEGGLQLAALYFAYKQNEGAQHAAEALVLLMHLVRRI
ncbi:hypothetical protein [Actinoplanes cyaneus]|nr:hypothetical protein [Actinoplanes cyaneus]MCW2138855.1 hypothetical protein [Actinoplanes cyaneus]